MTQEREKIVIPISKAEILGMRLPPGKSLKAHLIDRVTKGKAIDANDYHVDISTIAEPDGGMVVRFVPLTRDELADKAAKDAAHILGTLAIASKDTNARIDKLAASAQRMGAGLGAKIAAIAKRVERLEDWVNRSKALHCHKTAASKARRYKPKVKQ